MDESNRIKFCEKPERSGGEARKNFILLLTKKGRFVMMDFFRWVNSYFYGEHWYIYWGVIALIVIIALSLRVPAFVKSIKAAKERKNVTVFEGKQGNGENHKTINNH